MMGSRYRGTGKCAGKTEGSRQRVRYLNLIFWRWRRYGD